MRGITMMVIMDPTTVAAFTAAGLSLVNVIVTARMVERERKAQWKREEIKPVIARILTLSRETRDEWRSGTMVRLERLSAIDDPDARADIDAMREIEIEHYQKGRAAWDQIYFEVAQLQLIAPKPVSDAAEALRIVHESVGARTSP